MTGHLSDAQFEEYRERRGSASEMEERAEHLAGCAECRQKLLEKRTATLVAGLSEARPSHLTYEETEAYVDGHTGSIERELVESHVAWCESCAEQLRTLQQCAALLNSPPPVRPKLPDDLPSITGSIAPAQAAFPQMGAPTPPMPSSPMPLARRSQNEAEPSTLAAPAGPERKRRWPIIAIAILLALLLLWWLLRQ